MKVILEDKVFDYLKKKNSNEITVDIEGCASWGVEPNPSVTLGKPKENIDDFDLYEVNGVNVYVTVAANTKAGELTVAYRKILFSEKLIVEGLAF